MEKKYFIEISLIFDLSRGDEIAYFYFHSFNYNETNWHGYRFIPSEPKTNIEKNSFDIEKALIIKEKIKEIHKKNIVLKNQKLLGIRILNTKTHKEFFQQNKQLFSRFQIMDI